MKNTGILLFAITLITIFSCNKSNEKPKIFENLHGKSIKHKDIDSFIVKAMDSLKLPGLTMALIKNNKITYTGYFGVENTKTKTPVTEQTIFEAASLSKPLFAYFVMKQVDKGILDLDTPLYEYFPYKDIDYDDRYKKITARMVLSHTSGFPNWREGDSLKIFFELGSQFGYSGEGYQYLKDVVVHLLKTTDVGLDSIFQSEVSEVIGAKYLHYTRSEERNRLKAMGHYEGKPTEDWNDGDPTLFGSAYSAQTTAIDYAKFLIGVMEKKVLSEESLNEMLKAQSKTPEDWDEPNWTLGFGLLPTDDGTKYTHTGSNADFQAYCHFIPEKGYAIVMFCNSDMLFEEDFVEMTVDFLEK